MRKQPDCTYWEEHPEAQALAAELISHRCGPKEIQDEIKRHCDAPAPSMAEVIALRTELRRREEEPGRSFLQEAPPQTPPQELLNGAGGRSKKRTRTVKGTSGEALGKHSADDGLPAQTPSAEPLCTMTKATAKKKMMPGPNFIPCQECPRFLTKEENALVRAALKKSNPSPQPSPAGGEGGIRRAAL